MPPPSGQVMGKGKMKDNIKTFLVERTRVAERKPGINLLFHHSPPKERDEKRACSRVAADEVLLKERCACWGRRGALKANLHPLSPFV